MAYVRNDLPRIVKKFVKEHELYHLKDKSKNWIWREIKANVYGLFKHPIWIFIMHNYESGSLQIKILF